MCHDARPPFQTLIPVYLVACTSEGKSPKTVIAYRESLNMYLRLAVENDLPLAADAVTPTDVYRFVAAVRKGGVGDATQHRRHREFKHFFSWLKRVEAVKENPFQKVPLIHLEQQIVRPIEGYETERMLCVGFGRAYGVADVARPESASPVHQRRPVRAGLGTGHSERATLEPRRMRPGKAASRG